MKFAEKLVRLRKEKGISQEELANMLDVSRQAISRWEMGSTLPDINNIIKISDIFHASIDSLVRDEKDLENKKLNLLDKVKYKGDIAFIACPLLICFGLYIRDYYEFVLVQKVMDLLSIVFIVGGIVAFFLALHLYENK